MNHAERSNESEGLGQTPVFCDIVMKGGVTSGVTYPLAVVELARRFHLKNLGGTSAGAISAAFAAAAELRRRNGSDAGFTALRKLPAWLGDRGHLLGLFSPDEQTKPLFHLALRGASYKRFRGGRLALTTLKLWPVRLGLALLPGLFCLLFCLQTIRSSGAVWWLGAASVLGAISLMLAGWGIILWRQLRRAVGAVVRNGFGLASGMTRAPSGELTGLTPWLSNQLNELAGLDEETPLTFGHLWKAPVPETGKTLLRAGERSIDLRMVTTCLSHGRPYQLPHGGRTLYFDPKEFERLFPPSVVAWMIARAPQTRSGESELRGAQDNSLLPLPQPEDLPVVVAVRMSLSFPGLIAAIPLWEIDYDRPPEAGRSREPERIWFSDGGISSNFPVHFFDTLVPRWPTVAISLRQLPTDPGGKQSTASEVWAISSRREGLKERWIRFARNNDVGSLFGFFQAILDTMQNWYDNSYLPLPGYRDRVVELGLRKSEGGLNLDMASDTIMKLGEQGREAGRLMAERFTQAATEEHRLSWDDHRWTRYRSGMAALAALLARLGVALEGDGDWAALVQRDPATPPRSYSFQSRSQGSEAWTATERLLAAHESWLSGSASHEPELGPFHDPPRPRFALGVRPPM